MFGINISQLGGKICKKRSLVTTPNKLQTYDKS